MHLPPAEASVPLSHNSVLGHLGQLGHFCTDVDTVVIADWVLAGAPRQCTRSFASCLRKQASRAAALSLTALDSRFRGSDEKKKNVDAQYKAGHDEEKKPGTRPGMTKNHGWR
jgi:hypothetical protein